MEPNLPENEGYEYAYARFEQLLYIYIDSSKHEPALSVNVSNINAAKMKEQNDEDKEFQLLLNIKELFMSEAIILLERIMQSCQYSSKTMHSIQTTESAPSALRTITPRSAMNA